MYIYIDLLVVAKQLCINTFATRIRRPIHQPREIILEGNESKRGRWRVVTV